jgi:TPR repeat protein
VAARTGRGFAVRRLVSLLQTYEPALQPALQRNSEDALRIQARGGNVIAAQALSDMYLQGKPFGKNIPRGLEYMEMSAGQGDGRAAARLGLMYLQGTDDVPADRALARAALQIAAESTDLGSRTMAENLLRTMPMAPPRRPEGLETLQTVAFTPDVATAPLITPRRRPDTAPAMATDTIIKPRPRPAGMAARIAAALQTDDVRSKAPPRRPAALEQTALQTGTAP